MMYTYFTKLQKIWTARSEEKSKLRQSHLWGRDPLAHPDIAVMSERERADLQFIPECIEPE